MKQGIIEKLNAQGIDGDTINALLKEGSARYKNLSVSLDEVRSRGHELATDYKEARAKLQSADKSVKETELNSLLDFVRSVRTGALAGDMNKPDKDNARDISFAYAVRQKYNMSLTQWLFEMYGVRRTDKLSTVYAKLGWEKGVINGGDFHDVLKDYRYTSLDYNNSSGTMRTGEPYRWVLPEIFFTAIELGVASGILTGLIAEEVPVPSNKATVPYILEGDLMPQEVAEGGDFIMGAIEFDDKEIRLRKYGIGVSFTDEFIMNAQLGLMNIALAAVGRHMMRGLDSRILKVLIAGEQADQSEQAELVGVTSTTDGFQAKDLMRVYMQMSALGYKPTDAIAGLEVLITDLNETTPQRNREFVRDYLGTAGVNTIMFALEDQNQILMVDATKAIALAAMQGGLQVEQERKISSGRTNIYVHRFFEVVVLHKAARFIIDKTQTFTGWSAGVDFEKIASQSFRD